MIKRKAEIDSDLQKMTATWREDWAKQYTPITIDILDNLIELINRGGKRLRGALAMESYYLHGGKDNEVAIGCARIIELVQAYLLIVDDIQDNSAIRRGGPAVHKKIGAGQAINAAMLANHQAMVELMKLNVKSEYKSRAAELLNRDLSITIIGQINDIYNQTIQKNIKQDEIINTLGWKTAHYTFISPLELGASLAGETKLSARLHQYGLNAGLAFQITDDILGVFGTNQETGKSANDDIREGKATLLSVHARENADPKQLRILNKIIGKVDATNAECDQIRAIFEATGARKHAASQAKKYIESAESTLGNNPEDFLMDLVRYIASRKT